MLTINAGRGGVVNVVWQLAEGLKTRHNCEVVVACDEGSDLPRLREMRVKHARVEFSRDKRDFLAARKSLARLYRDFQPEIVHSHSRWPTLVSLAAGRRPDVSTLHAQRMTSHGSVLDRGLFRRVLSPWGRIVTVLDEGAARHVVESGGVAESRIVVVPNGVDERVYRVPSGRERVQARSRFGLGDADRVLLYVGSMVSGKRPEWCVECLAGAVSAGDERIKLLMVGEGPLRGACERAVREKGMSDRCVFTGWLAQATEAFFAADLLLLPSEKEGFGLVCAEAMMCGVPCVRTRTGGCTAQIREGVTGWSVDVDDRDGFVDRVLSAIKDDATRERVGAAAADHAKKEFTRDRFIERMWGVYTRAKRESGKA